MGCLPNTKKPQTTTVAIFPVILTVNKPSCQLYQKRRIGKAPPITKLCWTNVIDFLNYSEVKEIGKVNRAFNKIAKQDNILIKFFKKKSNEILYHKCPKTHHYFLPMTSMMSFSDLRKKRPFSLFESEYSTFDEKHFS